jgi:hypothetical protein
MFGRLVESTRQTKEQAIWRHFQGASSCMRNPGLKPWAKIFHRFAVNPKSVQIAHQFRAAGQAA